LQGAKGVGVADVVLLLLPLRLQPVNNRQQQQQQLQQQLQQNTHQGV